MNTKASTFDIIVAIILIAALATSFIVGIIWVKAANDSGVFDSVTASKNIMDKTEEFYMGVPDNVISGIWWGSLLIAAILAYLFGQNIILRVISLMIDMLYLLGAVVIQAWWDEFKIQPDIASWIPYYPKTAFILDHSVLMCLVGFFIVTVALFASNRRGRGEFG